MNTKTMLRNLLFVFFIVSHLSLSAQNDSLLAQKWFEQARQFSLKAQYDSSNLYYEKALNSLEKTKQWHLYFYAHIFIADNSVFKGDYDKAEKMSDHLLKKIENHYLREQGRFFEGLAWEKKGDIAFKYGNYDNALSHLKKAEMILVSNTYSNKSEVTSIYNALGNVYREMGSLHLALDYFRKAINNYQKDKNEINAAIAQVNIANIWVMKEEYEKAIQDYEAAFKTLSSKIGANHPAMAAIYNNIASAYFYAQDYTTAQRNFEKALLMKRNQFGEMHLDVGRAYFNIGFNHEMQGNYKEANANFQKADSILSLIFKAKHPLLVWVYNRQGKTLEKQGKYKDALAVYEKALQANMFTFKGQINYLDYIRATETAQFKAETLFKIYQKSNAVDDLKKSLEQFTKGDALLDQTRKATLKESDKIELSKIKSHIYEQMITLNHLIYQKTQDKKYLNDVMQAIEKSKALILLEAMEESAAKTFAGVPDSLLQKEKYLKSTIAEYQQKLANAILNPAEENNMATYQDILFFSNNLSEMLIKQLEENYPNYFDLKYNLQMVSSAEIQKKMDNETLVLNYYVSDSALFVTTLSQKDVQIHKVKITKNQLKRNILGMRNGILFKSKNIYLKNALELYTLLFPQKISSSIKKLIIIPDNFLTQIPFEALLTNEKNEVQLQDTDFKAMPYLIRQFKISYAYSTQLFYKKNLQNAQKQQENTQKNDLLALAPVFADESVASVSLRTRSLLEIANQQSEETNQTRGNLFNGETIAPLPGTDEEVRTIFELFEKNQHKAQALVGKHAKEEIFKHPALKQFKFLHIATHGFVNEESPELSGILLAQDSTADEDGVLYLGELYNTEISADLVTLSACETGLGKIVKGEGVIGLARALLFAGARNLVVSLWKVNDISTKNLMISFYTQLLNQLKLNKLAYTDAIREAKLQLIQSQEYAAPYYWSSFILVGK